MSSSRVSSKIFAIIDRQAGRGKREEGRTLTLSQRESEESAAGSLHSTVRRALGTRQQTFALAVLAVVFGLRVARLEYQSLWYDEGSSIFLSRQSLPAITVGAAHDIHPPLYYYLLHFWMLAAGQTEFAVRSLSVVTGVLIVVLMLVLARRLFGPAIGLLAALLAAVSPLAVYYSQETRMYAQVTLFGLLSTYLLVRATEDKGRKEDSLSVKRVVFGRAIALARSPSVKPIVCWGPYVLAALACVYSQYVGVFVLVFHGLYVLFFRRRTLVPFAVSGALIVLGYVPWLGAARESLSVWPSTSAFAAGPGVFGDAAFRFAFGLSAPISPVTVALTALLAILAGWGIAALFHPRPGRLSVGRGLSARDSALGTWHLALSTRHLALGTLYLLVPIVAMFLLGYRKPIYNPKFALIALPGFSLLLALGISRLGRLRWIGLLLTLAAAGYSLAGYYFDPRYARDDYRGVARFIQTSGRDGDAILLNAPGQEQIFPYYYHGALPVIGLPRDRPLVPDKTSRELAQLNQRYRRLWLVLYGTNGSDPDGYVEKWLASKDYEIENSWFGNVRLTAFAVPAPGQAPNRPLDASFGGFARLVGYGLTPNPVSSGDVLQLGLRWKPAGPGPANEKVFTHVIDGEGNIWAQRDSDPVGGARPTTSWKTGETIDDKYGLLVLPGTPPGEYQVELGMYSPDSSSRLPVTSGGSGDRLLLPGLRVAAPTQPPSIEELRIPRPFVAEFGSFRLLGYGLTLVGQEQQRDHFAPGDLVHLTLFWQSDRPAGSDAHIAVDLLHSGSSTTVASRTLLPQHPTSSWQPGDRYRDQYRIALPSGLSGGAELAVRLDGGAPVQLTRLAVG